MIDPTAAPPTVRFAVLAPRDLPVNSYSPVTTDIDEEDLHPFLALRCDFEAMIHVGNDGLIFASQAWDRKYQWPLA
jgi:hypothetical protein